jgi:AraC-like DNA-binding protein
MRFHSYIPRSPLRELVEDFRSYEGYVGEHPRETILPSGVFGMMFNLRDNELRIYDPARPDQYRRFSGALISGPYAGPFVTDAAEETAILGVHFKPGGAFPLLGLPAGELINTHIDLKAIWGPDAGALRNRLSAFTEPVERFRFLERAILARLSDRPRRHRAVSRALHLITQTHGQMLTRDVAKTVDLSQRRLIEVFTAEVGLTPKLFARVRRFQRAVALSRGLSKVDWAELAAGCGYFDQAHLVRDFVEFAGISPAEYWRRQRLLDRAGIHVKRNHLPMAG